MASQEPRPGTSRSGEAALPAVTFLVSPPARAGGTSAEEHAKVLKLCEENLDKYLLEGSAEYLLKEPFRELEMKVREVMRNHDAEMETAIKEIEHNTASNILGFPTEFLETKLCDWIQKTDNPATVAEFFHRMDELGGDNDSSVDDDSWETAGTAATVNTQDSQLADIIGVPGNDEKETKVSDRNRSPIQPQKNLDHDRVIPETPCSDMENNNTHSSSEIFGTPVGKHGQTFFADFRRNDVGETQPPVPKTPPPVFQFVGNNKKEARLVKPGEVLFSATGSPISLGNAGLQPLKSENTADKLVTITGPPGEKFELQVLCRGRQPEYLNQLVTDIRGLVTTRSVLQHKLVAPRVPNSVKSGVGSKTTCGSRKQRWRV